MAGAIAGAFMNVATSGHCLFVDVVYWVQATTHIEVHALTHENIKQVLIPSATTLGQHKSMQAKGSQWHDNALYSIRVIS